MRLFSFSIALSLLIGATLMTSGTLAQDDGENPASESESLDAESSDAASTNTDLEKAQADTEDDVDKAALSDMQQDLEEKEEKAGRSPTSPIEDPDTDYWFLGLTYQHFIFPEFYASPFADASYTINAPMIGISGNYRKKALDVFLNLTYTRYDTEGPFLGKNEPETAVEYIDIDGHALVLEFKIMGSLIINEYVSLQGGVGLGAGYLIHDSRRTEAYRGSDGRFQKCNGPGNPNGVECPIGPGTNYDNPNGDDWFNGGVLPPNFWLRLSIPEVGVRIKPIKQLVIRIYGGLAIPQGFYFGAGAYYGF